MRLRGSVFVYCPESRIASRGIGCDYDELVSGSIIYTYVGGNPIRHTDPFGLATVDEIATALQTIKEHIPEIYPVLPTSVTPVTDLHNWMGLPLQGYTDLNGNIQINANLYGDCNTPVSEFVTTEFLQTIAHEWQHVQQSAFEKMLTHGKLHNQIDRNAEIIAQSVVKDYLRRIKQRKKPSSGYQCGCNK